MERPPHIALEVLEAIQKKQFVKWWEAHLPQTNEKFPWKEREILPNNPYKPLGIIEIKGISEAGKSTGLRYLTNNPIKGYRQIIRPELIVEDLIGGLGVDYNLHELKSFMRILQGDGHRALLWNMIKNISFSQGLKQIIEEIRKDAVNKKNGLPPKLIIERGPHDVLTTSYLAAKLTEGTKDITRSEEPAIIGEERYLKPDFDKHLLETFSLGLSFGEAVNAVVLYYVSREEQVSRRLNQGKKKQGDFISDKTWPDMLAGEEFWLNCIYPLYREHYGMGLLLLNGANLVEENNLKLKKFCEKVFELTN